MAEKSIILRLSTFSDDVKTQLRIIGLLALTYRASLDTLMKLFPSLPKEPEKLFDLLIDANYSSDYHQPVEPTLPVQYRNWCIFSNVPRTFCNWIQSLLPFPLPLFPEADIR